MMYRTTDLYETAFYIWNNQKPAQVKKLGKIIEWAFEYNEEFRELKDKYNLQMREYVSNIVKLKADVKNSIKNYKTTQRRF